MMRTASALVVLILISLSASSKAAVVVKDASDGGTDIILAGGGDRFVYHSPSVQTTSGHVLGVTLQEAHAFYGIPFAVPPVGDLRFKAPKSLYSPDARIDATHNEEVVCYQLPKNCSEGQCYTNLKEDCLVLNVYVPANVDLTDLTRRTPKLPVMVYIYGGNFFKGAGTEQRLDGRWLAKATNTIVVTPNYRVGALGFLYLDGEDGIAGNQGLKDQQRALEWVQENIEHFGGDRDRVTLFGGSAGAQAILFHMVSPVSKPLFRRAIVQSYGQFRYPSPVGSAEITTKVLGLLGCVEDPVDCLRNATPEALVAIQPNLQGLLARDGGYDFEEPFRPFIDGKEFTDQPINLFRDGRWNTEKELIIGSMTEEMLGRDYGQGVGQLDKNSFMFSNMLFFGKEVGPVLAQYYGSRVPEGEDNFSQAAGEELTDVMFTCPTRALARFAHKTSEGKSVYLYTASHGMSGPRCEETNDIPYRCNFAYHDGDTPLVFRSGHTFGYIFDENDTIVADEFSTYFGSFARTGDPSQGLEVPLLEEISEWPRYEPTSWKNMMLQPPKEEVQERYMDDVCDFVDSLGIYASFPEEKSEETTKVPVKLVIALVSGSMLLSSLVIYIKLT